MIRKSILALLIATGPLLFAQVEITDKIEPEADVLRSGSLKSAFQLASDSPLNSLAEKADQQLEEAIIRRDIGTFLEFYQSLEQLEEKTGKTPHQYNNISLLSRAGSWIQKDQSIADFDWTSLMGLQMDNPHTESALAKMAAVQSQALVNEQAAPEPAMEPARPVSNAEATKPLYQLKVINQYKEPVYLYHNGVYHSKVYAGKSEVLDCKGGCQSFEVETRRGPVSERSICFTEGKKINWTLN